MKNILLPLLLLLLGNHRTKAQSNLIINKYENISFVSLDTLGKNQCTIIEYNDFIVIIELPIAEWELTDNGTSKVELFASFLNENFTNKPVKYILCSHWHLHSLSSIDYFIEKGAKVIVTTNNWNESTKRKLISSENIKKRWNT
jgi:mRNA degradation ribonuclease J1/J2